MSKDQKRILKQQEISEFSHIQAILSKINKKPCRAEDSKITSKLLI
jgi:hypothetical protein